MARKYSLEIPDRGSFRSESLVNSRISANRIADIDQKHRQLVARTIHPRHAAEGVERTSSRGRRALPWAAHQSCRGALALPEPDLPYTECRTRSEHDKSSNAHFRHIPTHGEYSPSPEVSAPASSARPAVCVGYIDHASLMKPRRVASPSFLTSAMTVASTASGQFVSAFRAASHAASASGLRKIRGATKSVSGSQA